MGLPVPDALVLALLALMLHGAVCQMPMQQIPGNAQVKISDQPFPVANAQQLNQVIWTMLGTTTKETIYCVSESPVSQLRFSCVDCREKNISDMVDVLNSAQDLTRSAGFPTVALRNVPVNVNWTGATIICQAALAGGTVDSAPAVIDVRYLRNPHVVDNSGQSPIILANQGYRFYVECIRGPDGTCQSGRRKTLRCAVQAHPPATTFKWLKNGALTGGAGAELTVGPEYIGQSIQCSANNGLFTDTEMPTSQAVQIDPYSAARVLQDNFQQLQTSQPFQAGNRLDIGSQINLGCQVEGNPRPVVFWRLRLTNGQVVNAACPQGFEGQYQEVTGDGLRGQPPLAPNMVRLNALCSLRIANYSFSGQYWCSACSYVSQGSPECAPGLEAPAASTLTVQVQGAPMPSDAEPTVEENAQQNSAIVTVHYCAEPMPRPPREISFLIDSNEIQVGQTYQNYKFENTAQNNTVPNCYMARLRIQPVHEEDQNRVIQLKVTNQFKTTQIPVQLDQLLGDGRAAGARISGWWIALIVVAATLLLLLCLIAFCVKRKLFCFNKVKQPQDHYGDARAKANLNVRDVYRDDEGPRLYAGAEKRASYHEGLNFAELNLSERTPVVAAALPIATDYRRGTPSIAPSINSQV